MKTLKRAFFASFLAVGAAGLHYALPQVDVVRAVGVETKRIDTVSETGQATTRDVYFLQTESLDGEKVHVYRNEDNFLYAKWNSADIQARLQSLAANKDIVAVKHYGWRIRILSLFPNALSVKPVTEDYKHLPVLNIVILLGLAGLGFLATRTVRSRRRAAPSRGSVRVDFSDVMEAPSGKSRNSDVDDFLSSSSTTTSGSGSFGDSSGGGASD